MYQYGWLPGSLVQTDQLESFSALYSAHYGIWGGRGPRPGEHVRLGTERIRSWLTPESHVFWATALGEYVGYAIAVRAKVAGLGDIAWVTQLVVHEGHRHNDIGKTLLFSVWRFTDYFAWGLLSANPYAIRALEKATRRRCIPLRISANTKQLMKVGAVSVPYLENQAAETVVTDSESRVNTKFYVDHSQLSEMLRSVISSTKPWTMGTLPEGWEWFAFTFRDQEQLNLPAHELEEMLAASDEVTREAYSRMPITAPSQRWAAFAKEETDFIIEQCRLSAGQTVLDVGCGPGRHSIKMASLGLNVTGVDYVDTFVQQARSIATTERISAKFMNADCRTLDVGEMFDGAICLYDVVGSYVKKEDNAAIVGMLARHLKPGAFALISVMSMDFTEKHAKHRFALSSEAEQLLNLEPSKTMESTGDVFDPRFYMIDRETKIVYRKEQFEGGVHLPEELIVRDRRYTSPEMSAMCNEVGLEVVWSRHVRAGNWRESLEVGLGKEILVLCRKPTRDNLQRSLF
jgi:2-polyprenyl-3-methyl-5-hydroxy-6-metoxy-1,4-benzoquinol methylase